MKLYDMIISLVVILSRAIDQELLFILFYFIYYYYYLLTCAGREAPERIHVKQFLFIHLFIHLFIDLFTYSSIYFIHLFIN